MAVTVVLTGASQNVTATNGSPNISFTAGVATKWVVGATVQGTGWAAGTKIVSITGTPATATAAVLSNNFTGTTGTASVIVSSNTGSLSVTLSASGDTASPTNIISAGFGTLRGNKTIEIVGATKITLQIANGATWDDTEWVYELGVGSSLRCNESYGTGTWRSGWVLQGSTYVKAKGHTVNYNNFDGSTGAGGRNIFSNSGSAPTGYPTNKFTIHWNDTGWYEAGGSNAAAIPDLRYGQWSPSGLSSGRIVFDYQGDVVGANSGFGGSFGTIESVLLNRCIGGVGTGVDTTSLVSIGKFEYLSIPSGNTTGTNPDIKMAFPNNLPFSGFAPTFYRDAATTFIGANTTATEILDDYILPTNYPLITNSRNYSANTRTYRRSVNFTINDSNAAALSGVTLYVTSGVNVLANAVQAGNYSGKLNTVFVSWIGRNPVTGSYIAPLSSTDTRIQTAQFRKYGYQQQSVTYDLTNSAYSQPIFMLSDASLTGIDEATAGAITTAGIDWVNKTITPTANLTYDQINARIAWELAQTTNSAQADPRTINGIKVSLATGWSLIVNNGITISEGTNITQWFTPTITLNGTGQINAIYQTTAGTSTIWEFGSIAEPILAGTSLAIYDNAGVTKYYNAVTVDGVYRYYIPPQAVGETYTYAIEKYGTKRESGTFPSNAGGILFYVPSYGEDVGITETNRATVQAYTTLSTTSQIYDATANFRLSETGIKLGQLVSRDGLYLDFGTYNVKLKDDASDIVGVASGTITYKSIVINETTKYNAMKATPPATITITDNELINVVIEDANGDSQLTILGGDNLGYELWKVTTATATDDYATGTLLTTLATNTNPYRFIGISGYDIVGRDVSSGVRRRSSMAKGVYEQAFYVGNQIQLASDAPQLVENNEKLSEVITKLDAKLDVAISTRLATVDYEAPHNTEIDAIKLKVDTLENTDLTGIATATNVTDAKDEIIAELANIDVDLTGVATTQNVTDAKNEIIAEVQNIDVDLTGVALEATSQEIKTKVLSLENYNDSTAQSKLDAIKAKTDTLVNTDLTGIATAQNVTDAQNAIETKIDNIVVDNEAIANEVWNQEPERLKQVATVETTGDQLASFNNA